MTTYFAVVRESDNAVIGVQMTPAPSPPPEPDGRSHPIITKQEYAQLGQLRHAGARGQRWVWNGDDPATFTEQADARPRVRVSVGGGRRHRVDTPPQVTFEVLDDRGRVDAAFSGDIELSLTVGEQERIVRVPIVNGTATRSIPAGLQRSGRFNFVTNEETRVEGESFVLREDF